MGKMIGAAEFKTHCLRILAEVERTREPVKITNRGRVVGELHPPSEQKPVTFGFLKHPDYRCDIEPEEPAYEGPWNAELDRDEDDPGTGL